MIRNVSRQRCIEKLGTVKEFRVLVSIPLQIETAYRSLLVRVVALFADCVCCCLLDSHSMYCVNPISVIVITSLNLKLLLLVRRWEVSI